MEIYLGYFVCLFKCLLALPILSGDELLKLILKCCLDTWRHFYPMHSMVFHFQIPQTDFSSPSLLGSVGLVSREVLGPFPIGFLIRNVVLRVGLSQW